MRKYIIPGSVRIYGLPGIDDNFGVRDNGAGQMWSETKELVPSPRPLDFLGLGPSLGPERGPYSMRRPKDHRDVIAYPVRAAVSVAGRARGRRHRGRSPS